MDVRNNGVWSALRIVKISLAIWNRLLLLLSCLLELPKTNNKLPYYIPATDTARTPGTLGGIFNRLIQPNSHLKYTLRKDIRDIAALTLKHSEIQFEPSWRPTTEMFGNREKKLLMARNTSAIHYLPRSAGH